MWGAARIQRKEEWGEGMETAIIWIMACAALLGGADRMLGNRLRLGEKFEQGFQLLGPTALSMAGILCLVPLISRFLRRFAAPLCVAAGVDPAMLAGLIAIDMGGQPLAMELARDPAVGRFSGIVVAAILGCTLSFTIPVSMGALDEGARPSFSRGVLFGLVSLPVALAVGGALCGLPLGALIRQSLPVLLISLLVLLGLWRRPAMMVRGFSLLARGISMLSTLGLTLGAFSYMTGRALIPGLAPLEEGMSIVAGIGIVMLGSLPAAELLQRALRRPLEWLGARTGMNRASVAALLVGAVSVMPAVAMFRDMDERGRVVNAAALVCSGSALAAHLGYAAKADPGMLVPLLAAKFAGAVAGALIALAATARRAER